MMQVVVAWTLSVWLLQAAPSTGPDKRGPEPAAPPPSTLLRPILDELDQQIKAQNPQKALELADRGRSVSLQNRDPVGSAYSNRGRARALDALRRNAEAASAWRQVAAAWAQLGEGPEQIEALAALALLEIEHPEESKALRTQALRLSRSESKRPLAAAQALDGGGIAHYAGRHLEEAHEFLLEALSIRERQIPDSVETAKSLNRLGTLAGRRGDMNAAREYSRRALAMLEEKAPNSTDMANSLNNLGNVAFDQEDLAAAGEYHRRALAIREVKAPDSLEVADSLDNLGNVAARQGDLAHAGNYFRRSVAIREEKAPDPFALAGCLNNLCNVVLQQGDLAAAHEYCRRALAIIEEKAPNSLLMAGRLSNLATVVVQQGDFAAAQEYYRRALAIIEEKVPNSREVAKLLNNLGSTFQLQEDFAAAREYYRRALAILEEKAPGSMSVALSLGNLGTIAFEQGDPAAAADYLKRALAIQEKWPNSQDIARTLRQLGNVALRQGDLAAAGDYCRRGAAILEKQAPNSLYMSEHLLCLGKLAEKQGDLATAKQHFWRAWQLAREQRGSLSGDETLQTFGSFTLAYAAELIRSQRALGEIEAAFTTLEESRAQALQQLLFERSMLVGGIESQSWPVYQAADGARSQAERVLSKTTMAEALALEKLNEARRAQKGPAVIAKMQAEHDTAQRQVEVAQAAYTGARVKAEEAWADLKKSAPRAFAPALSLKQAIDLLRPGTLLVAFAVGDDQTQVFLLRSGVRSEAALSAYTLAKPRKELQRLVDQFRRQVTTSSPRMAATKAGRLLFNSLFPREARPMVSQARRLLISPDDSLWGVPFDALVTNSEGTPQYLGIEKPITYTTSLTMFAQARRDPPSLAKGNSPLALVVGDPIFDRRAQPLAVAAARVPPRSERSYLWPDHQRPAPLPGTGVEAARIAQLYGGTALTQEGATEAAVRQRIEAADVIHLATHGYVHPKRAMSSGILLTVPAREPEVGSTDDDGVLQAWEIQSQLKLKAELVVLSACETGRGRVVKGEGLVGLVRALQYAGARSIVTSHWAVNDESTRKLMEGFHRHLRQGLDKDVALQRAMTSLEKGKWTGHPYHWAAFFLLGDPGNPSLGQPTSVAIDRK